MEKLANVLAMEIDFELQVICLSEYQKKGIQYTICTDISKDGMLQGPSFDLYERILSEANDINLIASGGISKFDELPLLAKLGCE